ncbi:MAG: Kynurenine formamidase [Candidatus Bathyarchaeota archaeon BA1]|nr:MAG: Kynurenine formamidase [Candidatus Bathyarchaeota archaeon BA1]
MIDLKKYRIMDLSEEITPGELKVDGTYVHGSETRRLEAHQFIYEPDKTFMHWVDTETHVGTHVECPSHYVQDGKDVSALPIDTFLGEASVLNVKYKKPGEPITPEDLEMSGVKRGDILLIRSPYKGEERPYISSEAAEWMAKIGVKMLGVDNSIRIEQSHELMATHSFLLKNDIPIVERLAHLEELKRDRLFFIGLPLRIKKLDSSWIRAIALEEL